MTLNFQVEKELFSTLGLSLREMDHIHRTPALIHYGKQEVFIFL